MRPSNILYFVCAVIWVVSTVPAIANYLQYWDQVLPPKQWFKIQLAPTVGYIIGYAVLWAARITAHNGK